MVQLSLGTCATVSCCEHQQRPKGTLWWKSVMENQRGHDPNKSYVKTADPPRCPPVACSCSPWLRQSPGRFCSPPRRLSRLKQMWLIKTDDDVDVLSLSFGWVMLILPCYGWPMLITFVDVLSSYYAVDLNHPSTNVKKQYPLLSDHPYTFIWGWVMSFGTCSMWRAETIPTRGPGQLGPIGLSHEFPFVYSW